MNSYEPVWPAKHSQQARIDASAPRLVPVDGSVPGVNTYDPKDPGSEGPHAHLNNAGEQHALAMHGRNEAPGMCTYSPCDPNELVNSILKFSKALRNMEPMGKEGPGVNTYDPQNALPSGAHAVISTSEVRLAPVVSMSTPGVNTYDVSEVQSDGPQAVFDKAKRETGPAGASMGVHCYSGLEEWNGERTIEPKLPQRPDVDASTPGVNSYEPVWPERRTQQARMDTLAQRFAPVPSGATEFFLLLLLNLSIKLKERKNNSLGQGFAPVTTSGAAEKGTNMSKRLSACSMMLCRASKPTQPPRALY